MIIHQSYAVSQVDQFARYDHVSHLASSRDTQNENLVAQMIYGVAGRGWKCWKASSNNEGCFIHVPTFLDYFRRCGVDDLDLLDGLRSLAAPHTPHFARYSPWVYLAWDSHPLIQQCRNRMPHYVA